MLVVGFGCWRAGWEPEESRAEARAAAGVALAVLSLAVTGGGEWKKGLSGSGLESPLRSAVARSQLRSFHLVFEGVGFKMRP